MYGFFLLFSQFFLGIETPIYPHQIEIQTEMPGEEEKIYILTETDRRKLHYYRLIGFVLEYESTPAILLDPDTLPTEWMYNFLTEQDYENELYGSAFRGGSFAQLSFIESLRGALEQGEITLTKEQKEVLIELLERVKYFHMVHSTEGNFLFHLQWTIDSCLLVLHRYEPRG